MNANRFVARHTARNGALAFALLAGACVQIDPRPDFDATRELARQSTGLADIYDPSVPAWTAAEIDSMLSDGLSLDETLRLALTNNRALQADFQELGIAHADWVQSQLLTNPSLDLMLRFPRSGGRSMLEAILGFELLELWQVPAREEAARKHLDAAALRIARRIGEHATATRTAYYEAVAAHELYEVALESVALTSKALDAVTKLHAAGSVDAFEENVARGPQIAARISAQTRRVERAAALRELAKLTSLERRVQGLELTDDFPAAPARRVDADALAARALNERLDLRAIRVTLDALDVQARLEGRKAWGDASIGPAVERPADGTSSLIGPSVAWVLPLFDQNQAQIARVGFEHERLRKVLENVRIVVAHDVRSGADRVNAAASGLALYREELLPQASRSLALARESYAAGRTPLANVMQAQQELLAAREGHVTQRRELAQALCALEGLVGGKL